MHISLTATPSGLAKKQKTMTTPIKTEQSPEGPKGIPDETFGKEVSILEPELSSSRKFRDKMTGKQWFITLGAILVLTVAGAFIMDPGGTLKDFDRNSTIPCDELTAGDKVYFEKAVFTGTYPDGKFSHLQEIEGEIIQKSYWAEKNLIMLTVKDDSGKTYRISDMNIYRNGCKRELWDDEKKRSELLGRETSRLKLNEPIVDRR